MKYETKKGTLISIGNPDHGMADHLDGLAGRVFVISGAAGSMAAMASLAPKRGARAKGGLERVSQKVAAVGTAIGAGATAIRAIQSLRSGEGSGGNATELPMADDSDGMEEPASNDSGPTMKRTGPPPIADVRAAYLALDSDSGH